MPSIQTLVADLNNQSIIGIGVKPQPGVDSRHRLRRNTVVSDQRKNSLYYG